MEQNEEVPAEMKALDAPLSSAEKRFINRGIQRNSPILFLVQHIYSCRIMGLEPEFLELDKLHEMVQKFVIDGEG